MTPHSDFMHRAERFAARYNRATNRLIAGTRVAVMSADADRAFAGVLSRVLRDMGARVSELHSTATAAPDIQVIFAVGDGSPTTAPGQLVVTEHGALPGPTIPADASLAKRGSARIEWAHRYMPITRELAEEFAASGVLRGVRVGVVLVLEPKTAVLVLELERAGADVRVFAPANEIDAETAAALRARGIVVLGSDDADAVHEAEQARDLLRWQPELLIDDGAHLIRLAHEIPESRASLRGAAEETTSGVRPLTHMHAAGELAVPVVPVNNAAVKTLFDNLHGTGQTCVFAIVDELERLRAAHPEVPATAASTWLVLGYGPVGVGVARHARALGATVIVAEHDSVRALAAEADGYDVARAEAAVETADVVVSATGIPGTLTESLAARSRPGTVFAVAGGVDNELDFGEAPFREMPEISAHVSVATVPDEGVTSKVDRADGATREVFVLAHGYGVNYTASGGNPIEIMDLSFAAQLAAVGQLIEMGVLDDRAGGAAPSVAPGIYPLAAAQEQRIASRALASRGSSIDLRSAAQTNAATDWRNARYEVGPRSGAKSLNPELKLTIAPDRAEVPAPDRAEAEAEAKAEAPAPATTVAVYSARLVIPVTGPRIRNGAVAVKGDRIMHVGDRDWVIETLTDNGLDFVEEHWPGVITPGLVNAHTHLQYSGMAEVARRTYSGFDDWSAAFDAVYAGREHDWAAAAAHGAQLALATGTTAAADVVTDASAVTALHDAGLHGIAYWEVMGWSNAEWHRSGRDQTAAQLDSMPASPGVGVSPHAPYSLEVQPLLDVPDLVRGRGMRLHIHLAEARMELEHQAGHDAWAELGAESFRALRSRGVGVSSTQFVDHLGVLGPDCHIAHGVYMTERDRSLLRARGTSVALCPRSNEVIGLDAPPVAAYLREGNHVCVGTDSLSSSPSLDPLADLAALYRIARDQGYGDRDLHQRLFHALTLGGAHALGASDGTQRIGQLAVGALADLAFFDLDATDPDDALAELVEAGAGSCRRTIVAGITKYRHERYPHD